ncbi:hypothetical protein OYE22_16875 [Streptomyces sp. 71268]|uniref:hypothetical protein n=1 Tax=Streptomyces sp. 71268 TaxID=3002640 RepID=UPI0023FA4A37|nr:hypothetical protein [Streptomyces sp. 71268]WEV26686.1 hypothetical protein OYE22_16875 [Streptomyces sp. 71268]
MQNVFMGAFVLAVVVETVILCLFLGQLWRFLKRDGPEPTALRGIDVLAGAAVFGAASTTLQLVASTWSEVSWADTLLFASVFGIATAGCVQAARRAGHVTVQYLLLAVPLGFGTVAGTSGTTL